MAFICYRLFYCLFKKSINNLTKCRVIKAFHFLLLYEGNEVTGFKRQSEKLGRFSKRVISFRYTVHYLSRYWLFSISANLSKHSSVFGLLWPLYDITIAGIRCCLGYVRETSTATSCAILPSFSVASRFLPRWKMMSNHLLWKEYLDIVIFTSWKP